MSSAASSNNAGPGLPDVAWRGERVSRIILGAAQLGMDYGIANTLGRPDARKAGAIVETAWARGIRHFDTAQAYGDSESVLGRALSDVGVAEDARIESKLSPHMDPTNISEIAASIERTFQRLRARRLWCMMLHRASWLDYWDQGLGELLQRQRDAGRIQHIGVSLNAPEEAARCLAHPDVEVLQVAANAWDRRIPRLGVIETARANGQLCCVRSIYLKGLLTLAPAIVAERLPVAHEASLRWRALAARCGMPVVELAARFAMSLEQPLVVGAESPEQVDSTIRLARQGPLPQEIIDALGETLDPVLNETILVPRQWEDLHDAILNPSGM